MKTLIVLGGGASGILAAIAAAEAAPHAKILLLEKNPRIGKKLLATGNGRCNLDNAHMSAAFFFSSEPQTVQQLLSSMENPLHWFRQHGLLTREDEAGRIYPYSNQASDLLNLLLYWLETYQIEVRCDCTVSDIDRKGQGYVVCANGQWLYADALISALGGKAGPQFGTDGFAFDLAQRCGCQIQNPYPCLVPLNCNKKQIQGLSGIRVKAAVSLLEQGKTIHQEVGEVQFTDYGLSGIALFQLSGFLPRCNKPSIQLDLFPQWDERQLTALFLKKRDLLPQADMTALMCGFLHPRIAAAVLQAVGGEQTKRSSDKTASVKTADLEAFAHRCKHWTFTDLSPCEWKTAQTTGGGIALSCLEADFQLKRCPGLYFVGESTDCAGFCGGYNLHWAFGSGLTAGYAAARFLQTPNATEKRAVKLPQNSQPVKSTKSAKSAKPAHPAKKNTASQKTGNKNMPNKKQKTSHKTQKKA